MCLSPDMPEQPKPTPPPPPPSALVDRATPTEAKGKNKKKQGRAALRIQRKDPKTSAANVASRGAGVNA